MPRHHLQLVTGPNTEAELAATVAAAVAGGVDSIQLRNKTGPAGSVLAQTTVVRQLCHSLGAACFVNDRLDVALLAGADGVQLGEEGLPPAEVRRLLPPQALVGASVHSVAAAQAAAAAGADFLIFGNVFPTATHPGRPGAGLAALAAVTAAVDLPVLAIGGITPAETASVLATGCAGIAVISAIWGRPDPREAAAALRQAMDRQSQQPRRPWPWTTSPAGGPPRVTGH